MLCKTESEVFDAMLQARFQACSGCLASEKPMRYWYLASWWASCVHEPPCRSVWCFVGATGLQDEYDDTNVDHCTVQDAQNWALSIQAVHTEGQVVSLAMELVQQEQQVLV
jgi:hypothetical protein